MTTARRVSIRVLTGRAGSGKTRLALELCDAAVEQDWDAGFVTHRELVRFGASPGDEWVSEQGTVRFEGWERVEVPSGVYDAARISTHAGTKDVPRVDTWWLAPDVGMVQLKSDWGGMFSETMVRKRDAGDISTDP